VARYRSINTAAAAVPLSAHSSPLLVITTKLAAAILGGRLFKGDVLPAQYCPCGFATPTYMFNPTSQPMPAGALSDTQFTQLLSKTPNILCAVLQNKT